MPPLRSSPARPSGALPVGLSAVATLAAGALVAWLPLAGAPAVLRTATQLAPAAVASAAPAPVAAPAVVAPAHRARAAAVTAPHAAARVTAPFLAAQATGGLTCTATVLGPQLCVHGEDAPPADPTREHGDQGDGAMVEVEGGDVPLACYGDGRSGPRVRAVYARPEGSADRFAESLPSFRRWASVVDRQVDASAMRTGGRRHVRFVTTAGPDCVLSVTRVTLPVSAFTSFSAMVNALQQAGFGADGTKNLVWADASGYCGIASTYVDDSAGLTNANNQGAGFARVDRRCWGKVETHEIVHMLGGVQPSAPHSTLGLHCNDGEDPMCYDDGAGRSAQQSVCADHATVLDCRNDDYFSTAAPRGSYLQTHWNVARSSYLAAQTSEPAPAASPAPAPAPAPAAPSPAPSPSASPTSGGLLGGLLPALPLPAVLGARG